MPMELVHGFLALSAEMSREGNFSLLSGGIDGIEVPAFPATILSLSIVARVRVPIEESDRPHPVRILVYFPDGILMRDCGITTVDVRNRPGPRIGPFERGMISNILINLYGTTLFVGGLYKVDFLEGDEVFGTMTIPAVDAASMNGG